MTASATRAVGAGTAVIAVALLPALVAKLPDVPEAPEAPAVVVELTGDEGGAKPHALAIAAPGAPAAAVLRDETGLHTGKVVALPSADCAKTERRTAFATTDATETWCLGLQDIAAGSELKGTVNGSDGAKLPLVVRRRDSFLVTPLAVLLLGLVAGFGVVLLPGLLRRKVRPLVLAKLLASPEAKKVGGLDEWVAAREVDGVGRESIFEHVRWTVDHGPAVTKRASQELSDAVDTARSAGVRHRLLDETVRAGSQGKVRMEDLFEGPARRTKHADELRAARVARLHAVHAEIEAQARAVEDLRADVREEAEQQLGVTQELYADLKSMEELPQLDEPLMALKKAVAEATVRTRKLDEGFAPASVGGQEVATAPRGPLEQSETQRQMSTASWGLVTVVIVLTVLGYAALNVIDTGYSAKPLFHDLHDHLELFAAALGSGAAASVVALVGLWSNESLPDDGAG